MFDAQYLHEDQIVWTPWMARQGDHLRISAQLIQMNGTGSKLEVFGYTKKQQEEGPGSALPSTRLTISSVGTGTTAFSLLEDMVRFKIKNPSSDSSAYILFRLLPLSWYDSVRG